MPRNTRRTALLLLAVSMVACRTTTAPSPAVGCSGAPVPEAIQGTHPIGAVTTRASGLAGRPFGIRVSSGDVVLVTQQDGNSVARFRLGDLSTSQPIAVGADPGDVVFTRDGSTAFVSNFNDGTVHVLDVMSGARIRQIVVAPTNAYRLALAPDESRLYVTSTNGRLYSVDLTGVDTTTSVLLDGSLQGITLSRDGRVVFVSSVSGGVWRLNACSLAVTATANSGSVFPTQEVALGPNESELYVVNDNGYIDIRDASTLEWRDRVLLAGFSPFGLAVTPDGAQLFVTSPVTGDILVVDRRSGGLLRAMRVGGIPRRIAFDQSGSTAVVSNEGNWVDVIR